jgi:hypothetical protein
LNFSVPFFPIHLLPGELIWHKKGMKKLLLLSAMFLLMTFSFYRAQGADPLETTRHFAFYSHPWISGHHWLFQTAKARAEQPAEEVLSSLFQKLNPEEETALERGLRYYQDSLVARGGGEACGGMGGLKEG